MFESLFLNSGRSEIAFGAVFKINPMLFSKRYFGNFQCSINYFENLVRQFVSKLGVQETPCGYKPQFAPRLIIQIGARSELSLITGLLYFLGKGEGESKINGRWSPREIVRIYKFKFASKPYHANLRTKQIVIDIMKLFENWGSKFFRRCYPSPF